MLSITKQRQCQFGLVTRRHFAAFKMCKLPEFDSSVSHWSAFGVRLTRIRTSVTNRTERRHICNEDEMKGIRLIEI